MLTGSLIPVLYTYEARYSVFWAIVTLPSLRFPLGMVPCSDWPDPLSPVRSLPFRPYRYGSSLKREIEYMIAARSTQC